VIVCYGGAKPTDTHLISTIRAVDEEIFKFLGRREARKKIPAESGDVQMVVRSGYSLQRA
jgi:hypothetical protein